MSGKAGEKSENLTMTGQWPSWKQKQNTTVWVSVCGPAGQK